MKFFARHEVAGFLEQLQQDLEGLFLKFELCPVAPQLPRAGIQDEGSEAIVGRKLWRSCHDSVSL